MELRGPEVLEARSPETKEPRNPGAQGPRISGNKESGDFRNPGIQELGGPGALEHRSPEAWEPWGTRQGRGTGARGAQSLVLNFLKAEKAEARNENLNIDIYP